MTWHSDSRGRTVPPALQRACFRRDDYTCQRCGFIGEPNAGQLQADHIVNRAEDGTDTLDNLKTLCVPCHKLKIQAEALRGRRRRSGKRKPRLHPSDALSDPSQVSRYAR